jgi:hypothetical protein
VDKGRLAVAAAWPLAWGWRNTVMWRRWLRGKGAVYFRVQMENGRYAKHWEGRQRVTEKLAVINVVLIFCCEKVTEEYHDIHQNS